MVEPLTLRFDVFWTWLTAHPNCIVRAATPEAVLYDDEDLHWHFASDGPETLLVQVLRGKRLLGEIVVVPDQVTYVQALGGEEPDEFVFELVSETETEQVASWVFVLSHGYDVEVEVNPRRVH